MSVIDDINEAKFKISHDLHAPLVNIEGFSEELGNGLAEVAALVDRHRGSLPVIFRDEMSRLIEDDLNPCLDFLRSAVRQMDKSIDTLSHADGVANFDFRSGED